MDKDLLKNVNDELEKYKDVIDVNKYRKEIEEINKTIIDYNREDALKIYKKYIDKYVVEFDEIAIVSQNGKTVVPVRTDYKTDNSIKDDLAYIMKCIPIIAVKKKIENK